MTDLPEALVEKVARAIVSAAQQGDDGVVWRDEGVESLGLVDGYVRSGDLARSALSASGHAELVEALEKLTAVCAAEYGDGEGESDNSNVYAGEPDGQGITFGHIRRARAALAKARGEG